MVSALAPDTFCFPCSLLQDSTEKHPRLSARTQIMHESISTAPLQHETLPNHMPDLSTFQNPP
jgi:hypothetical protein